MASLAPALETQSALVLIDTLRACTHDVFGKMVGTELTDGAPIDGAALRVRSHVVGQIGFGGSRSGVVVFHATLAGAGLITRTLLGMLEPTEPSTPEIADAIGEITNMIAGSFRTRVATAGDAWAISIPTVTIGSDFFMTSLTNGRSTMLPFYMGTHELFVELIITTRASRS